MTKIDGRLHPSQPKAYQMMQTWIQDLNPLRVKWKYEFYFFRLIIAFKRIKSPSEISKPGFQREVTLARFASVKLFIQIIWHTAIKLRTYFIWFTLLTLGSIVFFLSTSFDKIKYYIQVLITTRYHDSIVSTKRVRSLHHASSSTNYCKQVLSDHLFWHFHKDIQD